MGIEVWALIALVVVSTVYLLPFLVGRREMMGLAHAEDRYSAELRVLATGEHPPSADEACTGGAHAQIFRKRPEVKAMNRPAVRNVRALRTERELARARRVHEDGRRRRAEAASHRAVVASVLLGVTLGVIVVAAVTVLPMWTVLVPAVLLAGSMAAGRRAAIAAQESDRRERRRIADLQRRLDAVTGDAPRAAAPGQVRSSVAGGSGPERPTSHEREQERPADLGSDVREEIASPITVDAVPREQVAGPAAERATGSVAAERPEAATSTPPQGWKPVHVPAPTYTLAARAPRRHFEAPVEEAVASAPVPARPQNARSFSPSDAVDEAAHRTIDLDAALERRRAVGE